jgi:hypothetical protein
VIAPRQCQRRQHSSQRKQQSSWPHFRTQSAHGQSARVTQALTRYSPRVTCVRRVAWGETAPVSDNAAHGNKSNRWGCDRGFDSDFGDAQRERRRPTISAHLLCESEHFSHFFRRRGVRSRAAVCCSEHHSFARNWLHPRAQPPCTVFLDVRCVIFIILARQAVLANRVNARAAARRLRRLRRVRGDAREPCAAAAVSAPRRSLLQQQAAPARAASCRAICACRLDNALRLPLPPCVPQQTQRAARSARTSCPRWRRWKAWRRRAVTQRCPMSPPPCTRTARASPRWTRAWPRAPRRPWVRYSSRLLLLRVRRRRRGL